MGWAPFKLITDVGDEDRASFNDAVRAMYNTYEMAKASDEQIESIGQWLNELVILKGASAVSIAQLLEFKNDRKQCLYCLLAMNKVIRGVSYTAGHTFEHHMTEGYQLFITDIDVDLGHIFMRPEKLSHKIGDLFVDADIDFLECPRFSYRYYTLAASEEDKGRFKRHVNHKLLKAIGRYTDLFVELKDKKMVVMTGNRVNVKDAQRVARFVFSQV